MNYGAPIIDASVVSEKVVMNGVVVADGYDPIIIHNIASQPSGGSSSSSGSTSSSSGSTSSGSTSTSSEDSGSSSTTNVKLGTHKKFENNQNGGSTDAFENIKVITEERPEGQGSSSDENAKQQLQQSRLQA